jgi:hypothetical protein
MPMTSKAWRPFWAKKQGKEADYDALVDGVPSWLRQGLIDWLNEQFLTDWDDFHREQRVVTEALRLAEVRLRIPNIDWSGGAEWAHRSLLEKCVKDDDLFLSLVDLALDVRGEHLDEKAARRLEALLTMGGSRWAVAPDRGSLAERVQPEAAAAARKVIEGGSRAGDYLAEAWMHVYGRSPHPGTGYREAVRATEAAVCPIIIPKDPKATLGKAIIALKDAPVGKFTTAFGDLATGADPLVAVRGLMELVWTKQLDRHGTDDESVPLHVSQEQAEAALHAALTLVQWFQRGFVARNPPEASSRA